MATAEIMLPLLGGWRDLNSPPGTAWTDTTAYLTFDSTTDELIAWSFRMPANYASGLTVKWMFTMVSATSGVVATRSEVGSSTVGDTPATIPFNTLEKSTDKAVPGVAGTMAEISHSLSSLGSLAAGHKFTIRLGRENATTGTNATGDMAVWAVSLTYTTT